VVTAAPGPQQPDEVRPAWWDDREWVPDDEVMCMYCQRYKNRKVCRCGDPNPPARPAAPAAQPDEKDWRTETVEEQAARYGLPVELLNARVTFTAQPVRDTEEGRR
jgi:hypothetical protein